MVAHLMVSETSWPFGLKVWLLLVQLLRFSRETCIKLRERKLSFLRCVCVFTRVVVFAGSPTKFRWVKKMARTAGGRTSVEMSATTTVAGGETRAAIKRKNDGCATVVTPGTHRQGESARFAMRSGTGLKDMIRTELETKIMTLGQTRKTDKSTVQWRWTTKHAYLEEVTHLGTSFKATCVRSTEYFKLADEGSSESGEAEARVPRKQKCGRRNLLLGESEKADLCRKVDDQLEALHQQESEFQTDDEKSKTLTAELNNSMNDKVANKEGIVRKLQGLVVQE